MSHTHPAGPSTAIEPSLPAPVAEPDLDESWTSRKRVLEREPSSSSDPPLFSSDDQPASNVEDSLAVGQRKRQYRGTWWDAAASHPQGPRKRRNFTRNLDSGVWLGSEDSEASLDGQVQVASQAGSLPAIEPSRRARWGEAPPSRIPVGVDPAAWDPVQRERYAERRVQQCLEDGLERVDLS